MLKSRKHYVLFGALCHYATYPIRGLRWRCSLSHLPIKGSRTTFGRVVFFYNFVDNLVPAKLGDLYAAHLARINFGIRRTEAIGSIVFLRMLDAWIVFSLAAVFTWTLLSIRLPHSVFWALMGGGVIALGSSLFMLLLFFLDKSLPAWIPPRIEGMVHAFRKGMQPPLSETPTILGLTAIIWILETLWITFLVMGFGVTLGLSEAVFLTMIPLLASAFPLTPAGAGAVELTLFSCLRLVGITAPLAESITLLNRFIDYWLHIALGGLMWLFRRRLGLRTWREVMKMKDVMA
jgi:uncharacterized protein (TIRG00374 family)